MLRSKVTKKKKKKRKGKRTVSSVPEGGGTCSCLPGFILSKVTLYTVPSYYTTTNYSNWSGRNRYALIVGNIKHNNHKMVHMKQCRK
ncbi:hypothetical protein M0804_005932 [Polistes exclamans]|nr:hypothetical protein M0804_005932 [Polistes exclamans]